MITDKKLREIFADPEANARAAKQAAEITRQGMKLAKMNKRVKKVVKTSKK